MSDEGGEVVNLNRTRKQRAKAQRAAAVGGNVRKHGRTRAERQAEAAQALAARRRLDGRRLDGPSLAAASLDGPLTDGLVTDGLVTNGTGSGGPRADCGERDDDGAPSAEG